MTLHIPAILPVRIATDFGAVPGLRRGAAVHKPNAVGLCTGLSRLSPEPRGCSTPSETPPCGSSPSHPTVSFQMAVVLRSQPSTLVSTGLSVATVALNVAGAAADAVPIAKQILNSAAHICAAAEVLHSFLFVCAMLTYLLQRIQKKREAMYLLVEKADMYAKQIDEAVAGCDIDASLQRRLRRMYSYTLSIHRNLTI